MRFSRKAREICDKAEALGRRESPAYQGVEHLTLALLEADDPVVHTLFEKIGVEPKTAVDFLKRRLGREETRQVSGARVPNSPRLDRVLEWACRLAAAAGVSTVAPFHLLLAVLAEGENQGAKALEVTARTSIAFMLELLTAKQEVVDTPPAPSQQDLAVFGRDLSELARAGRLRMPIGRQELIRDLARAMAKMTRNNVLLLGEPGVGKTAVVEGFAIRLLEPDLQPSLAGKRVVELNPGALVAGTKYRGDLEQRVRQLLETTRRDESLILFIDEVHQVIKSGETSDGSPTIKDLFLPALGRGDIRLIAATTPMDFGLHMEVEKSLLRRFEVLRIEEPSRRFTIRILAGVRPELEKHHGVKIADEALEHAVDLTVRHLSDRRLPDKAIDILDQTAATKKIRSLKAAQDGRKEEISAADVAHKMHQLTGIPIEQLIATDAAKVQNIEQKLGARVFGQARPVSTVARVVKTAFAGLAQRRGPLGVLFFVGPSGVGKTELAKALAEILFGSVNHLIQIDMSEYATQQSVTRLISPSAESIGFTNQGQLTGAVRRRPFSVVLLDEIEKAHPAAFDIVLQVLDEGRLTDSRNLTTDFKNTVIIMTSNLELRSAASRNDVSRKPPIGFHPPTVSKEAVGSSLDDGWMRDELHNFFRTEFINRIDEIVPFSPLTLDVVKRIVERRCDELNDDLERRQLRFYLTQDAITWLAHKSCGPAGGARSAARVFKRFVREPIAEAIVANALQAGSVVFGEVKGGRLVLSAAGVLLGNETRERRS